MSGGLSKETAAQRRRANHLANNAMLAHGLHPVKDQRRRAPYFDRAVEIVTTFPPRTAFDNEHLSAFDDLQKPR
jgi:hypothetical protein